MMTPSAPARFFFWPLLLAIVLLALWGRGWGIWLEPMWLDEAYSAYAAAQGWDFLWHVVPRYETHPPFYYSLLRAWTLLAGDGLVAHRLLGLVCGMLSLPLIALAAARLARIVNVDCRVVVLATLLIVAVSPVVVEMTREIRPYPAMILTYAGACLALLHIAERREAGLPLFGRPYIAYLGCTALILWLHNLGPLYAAALGLALPCVIRLQSMAKADWLWLAAGGCFVIAIWLPALFILLDQAPEWIKATWLHFSTRDLWRRATMLYTGPRDDMRAMAAILLLLGGALLWRAPRGRPLLAALGILAFLPLLLSLLISATITPVFIVRTMTALATPALLLMGLGIGWGRGRYGWLLPAAALVWLAFAQFGMVAATRAHPQGDWYRAVAWLQPRFAPGDQLFAYPNEGALPFDRAVRDRGLRMPSRPIPTAIPTLNPPSGSWYVSGSRGVPSLDRSHLREIAQQPATRAVPTIWLLRLGPWAYDKGDVFLGELSHGRVEVGRYREGPIDIVGLRRADLAPE